MAGRSAARGLHMSDVMQQPGTDLTYGAVPGAPRSNGKTIFSCSPVFDRKILQKSQGARGPTQCKSGRAITWFVRLTIYCTFFNNNSPPPRQFLCNKIL